MSEREREPTPPLTMFVQEAIDYQITGSRSWTALSGQEQDAYLRACFEGEEARREAELRLDLFDRVASSVAEGVLGPYWQYDINSGIAHYHPESPARVHTVLMTRLAMLSGTPLGERLRAAMRRWGKSDVHATAFSEDPKLEFEPLDSRRTPGLVSLAESATGDVISLGWYKGPWNDWDALLLHQAKAHAASKELREEREWQEARALKAAAPAPPLPEKPTRAASLPRELPPPSKRDRVARDGLLWSVVLSLLLAWALVPANPYGYYVLLRWLTCGYAVALAIGCYQQERRRWANVFGMCALIYNPLAPLALGREVWSVVNVLTIVLLSSFEVVEHMRASRRRAG